MAVRCAKTLLPKLAPRLVRRLPRNTLLPRADGEEVADDKETEKTQLVEATTPGAIEAQHEGESTPKDSRSFPSDNYLLNYWPAQSASSMHSFTRHGPIPYWPLPQRVLEPLTWIFLAAQIIMLIGGVLHFCVRYGIFQPPVRVLDTTALIVGIVGTVTHLLFYALADHFIGPGAAALIIWLQTTCYLEVTLNLFNDRERLERQEKEADKGQLESKGKITTDQEKHDAAVKALLIYICPLLPAWTFYRSISDQHCVIWEGMDRWLIIFVMLSSIGVSVHSLCKRLIRRRGPSAVQMRTMTLVVGIAFAGSAYSTNRFICHVTEDVLFGAIIGYVCSQICIRILFDMAVHARELHKREMEEKRALQDEKSALVDMKPVDEKRALQDEKSALVEMDPVDEKAEFKE